MKRVIIIFLFLIPLIGWSQKPRLISQNLEYRENPQISNAEKIKTYTIITDTNDDYVKKFFSQSWNYQELHFTNKEYVAPEQNPDLYEKLIFGNLSITDKAIDKESSDSNSGKLLYFYIFVYSYPVTYSVQNKEHDVLFEKTYAGKGKFKSQSFESPDLLIKYTDETSMINQFKESTIRETLEKINSDKEILITGKKYSGDNYIYYLTSSKKTDFSDFENQANITVEALKKLNNHIDIGELSKLLDNPILFWKQKAEKVDPNDKNNEWVIPVCYYNLGLCLYHLNRLDEAEKYASEIDISGRFNLILYQDVFNKLLTDIKSKQERTTQQQRQKKEEEKQIAAVQPEVTGTLPGPMPDNYYQQQLSETRNLIRQFNLNKAIETAIDVGKKSKPFESAFNYYLEASILLSSLYEEQGKYTEAYDLYNHCYTSLTNSEVHSSRRYWLLNKMIQLELKLSRFNDALNHIEVAGKIEENTFIDCKVLKASLNMYLGMYYTTTGDYFEALDYYNNAIADIGNIPGNNSELQFTLFEQIGKTYYLLENYKQAKVNFNKALIIKKKSFGLDNAYIADSYILLANTYDKTARNIREQLRQKRFIAVEEDSIALDYLEKAKKLRLELFNRKDTSLLYSSFELPDFFNLKVQSMKLSYSLTLDDLVDGANLQRKLDENIIEAIAYYDTLIHVTENILGPVHPSLAYYHNELAEMDAFFYYKTTYEWKKVGRGALGKMERLVNFVSTKEKDRKSNMELQVENFYAQKKFRDQAIANLEMSSDILNKIYGDKHPEAARQNLHIAGFYQDIITLYYEFVSFFNNDLIQQESFIDRYKIESKESQDNYDSLVNRYLSLLNHFTTAYEELLVYDKLRLNFYTKAYLGLLSENKNEELKIKFLLENLKNLELSKAIISPEIFRDILYKKCHYKKPFYEDLAIDISYDINSWAADKSEEESKYGLERRNDLKILNHEYAYLDNLDKDLGTISDYDRFIDIMIQSYINEEDQFALAQRTKYHRLIAVEQILGGRKRFTARTDELKLDQLNNAFYYIEKTKALVLMSTISESEASLNTKIPADLIAKEKSLKASIGKTSRDIIASSNPADMDNLLKLKSELKELKEYLSKTYPDYNKSRYNLEIAGLPEIQSALDDYTTILSFTSSPDNLILFTITKSKIQFKIINLTEDEIMKQVRGFRNGIVYKSDESYIDNAKILFDKLIPKLNKEINKLIIIPDGELSTIPFEAFLTENVPKKDQGNYQIYPYLINNYTVSYAYSATLFLKKYQGNQGIPTSGFLGFAPVFSNASEQGVVRSVTLESLQSDDVIDSTRTRSVLRNGENISAIPSTESEVNNLYDLFESDKSTAKIYTHQQATETKVKTENIGNYRFIHFATHGVVNEKNPELSGLLLAQVPDEKEDGMLYAGEIYNLDINADLVSLSACETGLGKLATGEGVIGLSRAFTYAGAKNILVSLWKVADESTSLLMLDFYKNYLENKESIKFSNALRTAKLNMIGKQQFAHPYFWSPFILIGL